MDRNCMHPCTVVDIPSGGGIKTTKFEPITLSGCCWAVLLHVPLFVIAAVLTWSKQVSPPYYCKYSIYDVGIRKFTYKTIVCQETSTPPASSVTRG